ncbi:alpha-ribazole phosphatase [Desulforhopalus sp. 52FAK]
MKTIYLIRHGEIDAGKPRRFIGRSDLQLTGRGRGQIAELSNFLGGMSFDRMFCSPLIRCRDTAEIIAENLNVGLDVEPGLAEINLGCWEGLTISEIKEKFPGEYEKRGEDMAGYRPPGGESFTDLLLRSKQVLQHIIEETVSQSVVVSHAGVNRVLLCHILGMPLQNMFRLEQGYGCYNILHVIDNSIKLASLNSCLTSR